MSMGEGGAAVMVAVTRATIMVAIAKREGRANESSTVQRVHVRRHW